MSSKTTTTEPIDAESPANSFAGVRFQCRHIFTDGRRCGSPTLRSPGGHEPFCFYHHTTRRPASSQHRRHAPRTNRKQSAFTLPVPEDPSSIQLALGQVLQRIASNEIDSRRAGLLLYGLQIASLNLKKSRQVEENAPEEIVTEITHDPDYGLLAPPAELHADEPIGSAQRFLEQLEEHDRQKAEQPATEPADARPPARTHHPGPQPSAAGNLTIDLQASAAGEHETIFRMSNFIPKPPSPRLTGLGPKAQKLAALREKAAAQANNTAAHAADSTSAAKPRNNVAKKTAFQRKAT